MNINSFQSDLIFWDKKSLISLISSKEFSKLDSVAFANIFSRDIENIGVDKNHCVTEVMNNQPFLFAILDTFLGRIGLTIIPVLNEEIYHDSNLLAELQNAIGLAKLSGAKCASLTGLIPSATNYGHEIKDSNPDTDFLITTGHGTTVSAMVLNIEFALASTKRDIKLETIAFVGLGSIGLTTLQLMLSMLKHPKKLIICDIFSKVKDLENISQAILTEFNYKGEIIICGSMGLEIPKLIYEATLIIGATNVPDIVSTDLLMPGTIIVDDSAPHIFNYPSCLERFKEKKDVLVLQGGKLRLPLPITFTYNYNIETIFSKERYEKIINVNHYEIMGCTLGSILPLVSDKTPPTLGMVELKIAISYYNFLKEKGIVASSLQCADYYYQKEDVEKFINISQHMRGITVIL